MTRLAIPRKLKNVPQGPFDALRTMQQTADRQLTLVCCWSLSRADFQIARLAFISFRKFSHTLLSVLHLTLRFHDLCNHEIR